ncbi:extended synaptotagmin-3 [Cyprinodon tularosa]|uniref:extended synaptotagmin-3 n=1 Tax=Cyprinodon tularosa TaxID=77115 RepID=UPI0018E22088|nr:extended synaptotagmin-3 [Cyprinodon tularosa]
MASAAQTHPGAQESRFIPGSTERLSPSAVNRFLMEFLIYFGRAVVVFYPVYLTGYLGFSISWVLLCMFMFTWWQKNRQWKDVQIGGALDLVDNEKHIINTELKGSLQMASWVHFTDVEKANWVNKVLEQAWPFVGMYIEKLLKDNIQQTVRMCNSALKMFTFTKIHLGHKAPKITGIRSYTHEVDQREVILDMNINYDSDVDIDADVNKAITVGVKGLQFQGMLRVILEPLVGQAPLVGGVTLFFIRCPTLQINWTGMTNLLDSPGFSSLSEDTIMDIIASIIVLPNRMCFPLIDQVKVDQMRFPLPRGVVRVHVLEARDLMAKDTYMMGLVKGKSDPYATVRVGNRHFKTKTIKENLHPRWNEVYEFVVHEAPGQELEVELYDEDRDKDDFLGSYNMDLGEIKREKEMDQWFTLEGATSGEIHLKLQWLALSSEPCRDLRPSTNSGLSCAMLAIYLDSGSNLPKDHSELASNQKHGKHGREARLTKKNVGPSSYVEFTLDKDVQKSKVAFMSKDPVWEQGFTFFVHNIETQQLVVQVKEHEKKTVLGVFNLPLNRLSENSQMSLDQRFPLERSGANSQIKLKATLRILTEERPPTKIPESSPVNVNQQMSAGGNASVSAAHPGDPAKSQPADQLNRTNEASSAQRRRSSFLVSEASKSPNASMRRYDSHSLLSDNSIASSRFDLSDGASYPEAIRNHQGTFGEIHLTVRYANMRNKLIVLVHACRDLFLCSDHGTDSYVRMYLLPDHSWRHRKKTHVRKRTVNPVFEEKFEFDVSLEEAKTRKLDISVKNNKMFHTRQRKDIGMVMLDISQMDLIKGVSDWYELTLPGLMKSNK